MRPSNRTRILNAAVDVVQRDGVTALTFDSVAAETGLTRGGLLYHFSSREALISGIHQHLADALESRFRSVAGKEAEDCSLSERLRAYAVVCSDRATRAELQLALEAAANPADPAGPATSAGWAAWDAVVDQWAPGVPDGTDDGEAMSRFVARLAADGLWMFEAMTDRRLPEHVRDQVASRIAELGEPGSRDSR